MVLSMLHEMRAEMTSLGAVVSRRLDLIDRRLDAVYEVEASFRQALGTDDLSGKLSAGHRQFIEPLLNERGNLEARQ